MSAVDQVHWHEGLFLQPHHLQAMQRRVVELNAATRSLPFPYHYGLIAAQLAPDAVQNRQVRFERLRLVLRSGMEIDVPGNTDLPPLELGNAFESATEPLTVSIGIPIWYPTRGNALEPGSTLDGKAKRIYRVSEVQSVDENTGLNPQPVMVRRINARLLLDSDDRTDMEVLPLLRVMNPALGAVGLPRIDPLYYPPCLFMDAWEPLNNLVKDLVDQMQATRGQVARDIARDGFDSENLRPAQLKQLFRLIALNRYSARLPELVQAPRVTPFQVYLELREALAEFMALKPDGDFDVVAYDHDNVALAFKELAERIRVFLGDRPETRFNKWELVREGKAFVARGISREQLEFPEYYLAIETSEDRTKVAELVANSIRFKMLPASVVLKIAQRGVRLVPEHNPPGTVPTAPGLSYHRVERADETSAKWWEQIKAEGAVGVTWLGLDLPDVRITMYGMQPR
jgi:type VI secretion system ImpJ/VasE family protein